MRSSTKCEGVKYDPHLTWKTIFNYKKKHELLSIISVCENELKPNSDSQNCSQF